MDLKLSSPSSDTVSSTKIAKVFLIYPPTGVYMRDDRCQAPVEGMTAQPNRAPLDLAYMAAMLEQILPTWIFSDVPRMEKWVQPFLSWTAMIRTAASS